MGEQATVIAADGRELTLGDVFTIGRADDNDLALPSKTVSRYHVVITREGTRWFLEDRGSPNGTSLNGARVPPGVRLPLRHGDRIGVGAETVLFRRLHSSPIRM